MSLTKRLNPYARLLKEAREFADAVGCRHTRTMFRYPRTDLGKLWSLADLYERTKAAEQLGYDVVLTAGDEALIVQYVKKVPARPWRW